MNLRGLFRSTQVLFFRNRASFFAALSVVLLSQNSAASETGASASEKASQINWGNPPYLPPDAFWQPHLFVTSVNATEGAITSYFSTKLTSKKQSLSVSPDINVATLKREVLSLNPVSATVSDSKDIAPEPSKAVIEAVEEATLPQVSVQTTSVSSDVTAAPLKQIPLPTNLGSTVSDLINTAPEPANAVVEAAKVAALPQVSVQTTSVSSDVTAAPLKQETAPHNSSSAGADTKTVTASELIEPVVTKIIQKNKKLTGNGKAAAKYDDMAAAKDESSGKQGLTEDSDYGVALLRVLGKNDNVVQLEVSPDIGPVTVEDEISLGDAAGFSLQNNPDVKVSDMKLSGAKWEKVGSYGGLGPSIELTVDGGGENSTPASVNNSNGTRLAHDYHHRVDRNYTLTQPLIDLRAIADIFRSHSAESQAAAEDLDVREGVVYDTSTTYLKLLESSITIKLANEYKGYLDDLSKRMAARVAGGGATQSDLDRIKGQRVNAEVTALEARGEYNSNLSEFKRLTGIVPMRIKIPEILAPSIPNTYQEALDQSVLTNPAYQADLHKEDVAAGDRNKEVAAWAPKLSLELSKVFSYNAGGAADGNPNDGVYPTQTDERALFVARWAINPTASVADITSTSLKVREQVLRSASTLAKLEGAIRTSYNAINAANGRIDILKNAITVDGRVVRDYEEQYKNGGRTLFELLDAYQQLYNVRQNYMRVVIARAQASYQIHHQIGDLTATILGGGAAENGKR